jgi:hypothetical protein
MSTAAATLQQRNYPSEKLKLHILTVMATQDGRDYD